MSYDHPPSARAGEVGPKGLPADAIGRKGSPSEQVRLLQLILWIFVREANVSSEMLNQDLMDSYGARVSDHAGTPAVLLDRSFYIRAVNVDYEIATLRNRSELIGENIFEVFPDNPNDPHANGNEKLLASFETVLRTKSTVAVLPLSTEGTCCFLVTTVLERRATVSVTGTLTSW